MFPNTTLLRGAVLLSSKEITPLTLALPRTVKGGDVLLHPQLGDVFIVLKDSKVASIAITADRGMLSNMFLDPSSSNVLSFATDHVITIVSVADPGSIRSPRNPGWERLSANDEINGLAV
jgi:hypothetical protein